MPIIRKHAINSDRIYLTCDTWLEIEIWHGYVMVLYYKNDKRHRDDGPAQICANGTQAWYQNGKFHRDGGPAITWRGGFQTWYQRGNRHRVNGPAVTYANGTQEWWENGVKLR